MIKHEDGKWVLYTKDGSKVLGTHDTEEEAKKQEAAIEIAKHARHAEDGEVRNVHLVGAAGKVRTAKHDGRDHLVVPIVALMEGVIWPVNAETPELVRAAELSAAPQTWNGRPVVANHPFNGRTQVSANTPEVLASRAFGTIFNAEYKDGKLLMDLYLDPEKAKVVGDDALAILQKVEKDEPVEVSVGCYVTTLAEEGSHNGRPYKAVWQRIMPDHLAMLSKGVGACSNAMGCGIRHALANEGTELVVAGDVAGHEFHGNQFTDSPAGDGGPNTSPETHPYAVHAGGETNAPVVSTHRSYMDAKKGAAKVNAEHLKPAVVRSRGGSKAPYPKGTPLHQNHVYGEHSTKYTPKGVWASDKLQGEELAIAKAAEDLTDFDLRSQLTGLLVEKDKKDSYIYIEAVLPESHQVVYVVQPRIPLDVAPNDATPIAVTMFQRSYSVADDGTITLGDDATQVERETVYVACEELKAAGDVEGHEFHGNQYMHGVGSQADHEAAAKAHEDAAAAHMRAKSGGSVGREKAKSASLKADNATTKAIGTEKVGGFAAKASTHSDNALDHAVGGKHQKAVEQHMAAQRYHERVVQSIKARGLEACECADCEQPTPEQASRYAEAFKALSTDVVTELRTAYTGDHPFTFCMEHVIPAIEKGGHQVDDPKRFCGWWKSEQEFTAASSKSEPVATVQPPLPTPQPCGCTHKEGKEPMTKEQRDEAIANLTTCRFSGFTTDDKAMLEAASDARLEAFLVTAGARKQEAEKAKEPKALTSEEFMAAAPAEIKVLIERQKRQETELRTALVTALKAAQDEYGEAELAKMGIDELERLARIAKVQPDVRNFEGRGLPRALTTGRENDVYANPPDAYAEALKARK